MPIDSPTIEPRVPLPHSHSGRRVIALNLTMAAAEWTDDATNLGEDIKDKVPAGEAGQNSSIDGAAYGDLWRSVLKSQGARAVNLVGVDATVSALESQPRRSMPIADVRNLLSVKLPLRVITGRAGVDVLSRIHPMGTSRLGLVRPASGLESDGRFTL